MRGHVKTMSGYASGGEAYVRERICIEYEGKSKKNEEWEMRED
jgi:hypothetical protein